MNPLAALLQDTPGSTLLLAAMLVYSGLALFVWPGIIERNLFRPHWLLPQRQYATLVTSAFLHADIAHLGFNAFTFWAFAFGLEKRIGTPMLLALYAFGLMASNLGTWLRHRHEPGYRSLGASGAIGAVLFASIVYFPKATLFIMPLPVPLPAPLFALGYLAYSIWAARRARDNINHDAHLAGAIAGIVFVMLTDPRTVTRAIQQLMN